MRRKSGRPSTPRWRGSRLATWALVRRVPRWYGPRTVTRLDDELERWTGAGLLDSETAERIRAFEAARGEGPAAVRELALEFVAYLGIALASVGVATLIGQSWEQLAGWARILSTAVPSVLGFVLGFGFARLPGGPMSRAAQVAWVAAAVLLGGTAAVSAEEAGGSSRVVALSGTGATLGAMLAVWALHPGLLAALGVVGSLGAFGIGAGTWADRPGPVEEGLGALAAGVLALALVESRLLRPEEGARPAAAAVCLGGAFLAGLGEPRPWAEALVVALALGFLVWSAVRRALALAAVAGIGLFVGLVDVIFEYFEDELGAPFALVLSGAVILAGVLIMARLSTARLRTRGA